jgi:hypothetical protein
MTKTIQFNISHTLGLKIMELPTPLNPISNNTNGQIPL